jgi:Clp amino terminal domain, pathogenicity island component/UvrB/uvrC motif
VLDSLDVTALEVRAQVVRIVGEGDEAPPGRIPFTPDAKRVLELALREALSLGHTYIGTEHLLLGLAREGKSLGARILLDFDADREKIYDEVARMLSGQVPRRETAIERLRGEKEEAIEAQDWERAAELRDRERALSREHRASVSQSISVGEAAPQPPTGGRTADALTLLAGWLGFGVAFGIGLAVGRLIWG